MNPNLKGLTMDLINSRLFYECSGENLLDLWISKYQLNHFSIGVSVKNLLRKYIFIERR